MWALDDETVLQMRAMGVAYMGVLVRDNGDIWLTKTSEFFNRDHVKVMNYEGRGGALQRYLPLKRFRRKRGTPKL